MLLEIRTLLEDENGLTLVSYDTKRDRYDLPSTTMDTSAFPTFSDVHGAFMASCEYLFGIIPLTTLKLSKPIPCISEAFDNRECMRVIYKILTYTGTIDLNSSTYDEEEDEDEDDSSYTYHFINLLDINVYLKIGDSISEYLEVIGK